jgi:hypothetical protein
MDMALEQRKREMKHLVRGAAAFQRAGASRGLGTFPGLGLNAAKRVEIKMPSSKSSPAFLKKETR